MRKPESSYDAPEIREILGNAHPSKSPEEVGAESGRKPWVKDIPAELGPIYRAEWGFNFNKDIDLSKVTDEQGHINGQGREGIKDMCYGLAKAEGTACESIAVYNYLKDIGRDVSLAEVIRTADELGCMAAGGYGGILPNGVKRLLKAYGVNYQEVRKPVLQNWADHGYLMDGEQYIAIIWNKWPERGTSGKTNPFKGLHTFLLVYDEEGIINKITGKICHWIAYNRYDSAQEGYPYENLTDVLTIGDWHGRYVNSQILKLEVPDQND